VGRGWLETAGTDRLTLERDGAATGWSLAVQVGVRRVQLVGVGVYHTTIGAGPGPLGAGWAVEVHQPRTRRAAPGVYLLNDDDLTFATPGRPG